MISYKDLTKGIFFSAILINFMAFLITLKLMPLGAIESGIISRFLIDKPVLIILFMLFVYSILYLIIIYIPEKLNDKDVLFASFVCSLVLFVALFIDFLNDVIWLIRISA